MSTASKRRRKRRRRMLQRRIALFTVALLVIAGGLIAYSLNKEKPELDSTKYISATAAVDETSLPELNIIPDTNITETPELTVNSTPEITETATELPVEEPTQEPTEAPTEVPSPTPSPSPTPEPTPEPTPTPVPTPQPTPVSVKAKDVYKIVVNKGAQLVGIFTIDENGEYTIPVKYMICSTGKTDKLKNGHYQLKGSDNRYKWRQMFSGVWVHYATRISGNFLFHSLSYDKDKSNTLIPETYEALGTKASDGCVRLMVKDAKWIYDNMPEGTHVQVISGDERPDIMETIVVPPLVSGSWDPTDPDENNPDYYAEPDATPEPTRVPWVTPVPRDFKWSPELRSGRQS